MPDIDDNFTDDDDTDLSTLDRGDNAVEEGQSPEELAQAAADVETAAAALRDASGKFVKKPDATEPTAEEKAAADAAAAADVATVAATAAEAAAATAAAAAKADPENLILRHNKAMQQRDAERARADALEAENRALRAAAPAKAEPKVDPIATINATLDDLYTQVEEARADGDTKTAATLQRQIDGANREIGRIEAERIANRTSTVSAEDAKYNSMLETIEESISALNPQSEDFDRDQVKELDFQVAAYEKMGMNGPDALRRAIKVLHRVDPFAPAAKAVVEPIVEPAKAPLVKQPDPKKAVDTQARQPADASDLGVNRDSTKIVPSELSEEDYDKLPDSKKKELRGDFVTA